MEKIKTMSDKINGIVIPKFDIDKLVNYVIHRAPQFGIHGLQHSKNVELNGLLLANHYTTVNKSVVRAFAYLHDCCRMCDGHDPQHGKRAAMVIDKIRNSILGELSDVEISKLKLACSLHTEIHSSGLIDVDVCVDADRLDLVRCGIMPDPERMATKKGAFYAMNMNLLKTLRNEILL